MNKVNEGLRIIADSRHALAFDEKGMINAETLVTGERPPSVIDFLSLADKFPQIRSIADRNGKQLLDKWSDIHAVIADRCNYFKALEAAGVAYRVLGKPGRRSALVSAIPEFDIDYRPGLWLHADLILPLAQWMASRQPSIYKTPLVLFLEKHLGSSAPAAPIVQHGVADAYADEVDAKELAVLRKIDRLMMDDGVSAGERREVLAARISSMQGA